jgi:hypothetical protein
VALGLPTVGAARCHAPPLGEAVGAHEAAQRGVGRHRLKLRPGLRQRDEVVVMELYAPALVHAGRAEAPVRRAAPATDGPSRARYE